MYIWCARVQLLQSPKPHWVLLSSGLSFLWVHSWLWQWCYLFLLRLERLYLHLLFRAPRSNNHLQPHRLWQNRGKRKCGAHASSPKHELYKFNLMQLSHHHWRVQTLYLQKDHSRRIRESGKHDCVCHLRHQQRPHRDRHWQPQNGRQTLIQHIQWELSHSSDSLKRLQLFGI